MVKKARAGRGTPPRPKGTTNGTEPPTNSPQLTSPNRLKQQSKLPNNCCIAGDNCLIYDDDTPLEATCVQCKKKLHFLCSHPAVTNENERYCPGCYDLTWPSLDTSRADTSFQDETIKDSFNLPTTPDDCLKLMHTLTIWWQKFNSKSTKKSAPVRPTMAIQLRTWWLNHGSTFATITSRMQKVEIDATPELLQDICKHLNPNWVVTGPLIIALPQGRELHEHASISSNNYHIAPVIVTPTLHWNDRIHASKTIKYGLDHRMFKDLTEDYHVQALVGLANMFLRYECVELHIREAVIETTISVLLKGPVITSKRAFKVLCQLTDTKNTSASMSSGEQEEFYIQLVQHLASNIATLDVQTIDGQTFQHLCGISGVFFPTGSIPQGIKDSAIEISTTKLIEDFSFASESADASILQILTNFVKIRKLKPASTPIQPKTTTELVQITPSTPATNPKNASAHGSPSAQKKKVIFEETPLVTTYDKVDPEQITRYDLRLRITTIEKPKNAVAHIWSAFKSVYEQLKAQDPTIAILPWKETEDQTPLNFSSQATAEQLARYIPRTQIIKSGDTWGDIRILHTRKWDAIRSTISVWLREKGHGIWHKRLQVETTRNAGYLLYSSRSLNAELLADAFKNLHHIDIAFRFQNISTGTGPVPENEKVKALHVVCAMDETEDVKDILYKVYHLKATTFPFGVRMRFIPWTFMPTQTKRDQLLKVRKRQMLYTRTIIHSASWEIAALDTRAGELPTLRSIIMGMKSKTDDPGTPLFLSVDRGWNNDAVHVFCFLPRVNTEARSTIATLLPLLKILHGDPVQAYFTVQAAERSQKCVWDEETKEIVTADEMQIANLLRYTGDDDFFGIDSKEIKIDLSMVETALPFQSDKIERLLLGEEQDSVATFATGQNPSLVTGTLQAVADRTTNTNQSSTISLSDTVTTYNSRFTLVESNFSILIGMQQKLEERLDRLFLNSDLLPRAPTGPPDSLPRAESGVPK